MPAVRSYIAGIVANVVREYDVDGIHFDDYFYPYAEPGQVLRDDSTYKANFNGMTKADWRRDNVTKLVNELRDSIRANKPWVKFGISPFGIWKNQSSDPEGSATNGGQSYYEIYADTRKWVREGLNRLHCSRRFILVRSLAECLIKHWLTGGLSNCPAKLSSIHRAWRLPGWARF